MFDAGSYTTSSAAPRAARSADGAVQKAKSLITNQVRAVRGDTVSVNPERIVNTSTMPLWVNKWASLPSVINLSLSPVRYIGPL